MRIVPPSEVLGFASVRVRHFLSSAQKWVRDGVLNLHRRRQAAGLAAATMQLGCRGCAQDWNSHVTIVGARSLQHRQRRQSVDVTDSRHLTDLRCRSHPTPIRHAQPTKDLLRVRIVRTGSQPTPTNEQIEQIFAKNGFFMRNVCGIVLVLSFRVPGTGGKARENGF